MPLPTTSLAVLIDDDYGELWSVYSNADEIHPEFLFSRSTSEEAHEDAIRYMIDFDILPPWDWERKLTENPFLSGRDKYEITQSLEWLSHQIDDLPF